MMSGGESIRVVRPLFPEVGDGSTPISPLQLRIVKIDTRLAQSLNAHWHSILPETSYGNLIRNKYSACFGAEYANRWYAVAIWTSPVAGNRMREGATAIELRRLAIAPDAPKNSASRMLSVMKRMLVSEFSDATLLVSYQSVDHHKGTIYRAAGWRIAAEVPFMEWGQRPDSVRADSQITSQKVRWELRIRPEPVEVTA